ncbi:universal stress protein [Kutzneria albida]|uniref:UspA domain-containing protein n=1 Tax=Kutzneria albida DSM 43870 TaxID=1449976 RepID=W5WFR3_9PSEU|nr:universal stress protein [Kutzneria albida]AHH97014.1 hypothetical protein KALB_3650 [Kutzneria albida DSM 43870]
MDAKGKVVVGVDGSQASVDALRWALEEARRRDAEVHVVTAWHTDPPPVEGPPPVVGMPYHAAEEALTAQQAQQDQAMACVAGEAQGMTVYRHMVSQWPPRALVHLSTGADLLVLGRQGHSWVAEKLLGSVSAYCLRHARCPVVVVPARKPVQQERPNPVVVQAAPEPLY